MDLRGWIIRDHRSVGEVVDLAVLSSVPLERLAERPPGTANSILWLFWHLARTEDVAINTIVRCEPQVLEDEWRERLGADEGRIGTGFQDEEVDELSSRLNPREVVAYWRAVRERTAAWLAEVPLETLDEVPDVDARLAAVPGILPLQGSWLQDFWRGRKAGFFVAMPTINHGMMHVGEMLTVRQLLGIVPPVR